MMFSQGYKHFRGNDMALGMSADEALARWKEFMKEFRAKKKARRKKSHRKKKTRKRKKVKS